MEIEYPYETFRVNIYKSTGEYLSSRKFGKPVIRN